MLQLLRGLRGLAIVCLALFFAGCAMQSPPYSPSIDHVQLIKDKTRQAAKLGEFSVQAGAKNATSIGIRASSMSSNVGGDDAQYLAQALRSELEMAQRLDPKANIEITGVLLGTDIDTGMSEGTGYIQARFVVKNNGAIRFDKVKRGDFKWESSFVGAIAIPAAQQAYPSVVKELLGALYGDDDFQQALQ